LQASVSSIDNCADIACHPHLILDPVLAQTRIGKLRIKFKRSIRPLLSEFMQDQLVVRNAVKCQSWNLEAQIEVTKFIFRLTDCSTMLKFGKKSPETFYSQGAHDVSPDSLVNWGGHMPPFQAPPRHLVLIAFDVSSSHVRP
jgi:hypothetical protein